MSGLSKMFSATLRCPSKLEDVTTNSKILMAACLLVYLTLTVKIMSQSWVDFQYHPYLPLEYTAVSWKTIQLGCTALVESPIVRFPLKLKCL